MRAHLLAASLALLLAAPAAARKLEHETQPSESDMVADPVAFLEGLWNQCDKDGDGCLSESEFVAANQKLGIAADMYTSHGGSYAAAYASMDTNTSGCGLTKQEIVAAVEGYPEYKDAFISAFTNGAGQVPTSIPQIPTAVLDIEKPIVVEVQMKVGGPADQIYPGQRQAIKQFFADQAGVSTDAVVLLFKTVRTDRRRRLEKASSSKESARRELQSGGSETEVTASIYTADTETATAATAALDAAFAPDAPPPAAFDGVPVLSFTRSTREPWEVPAATYAVPVVLVLCCIIACCCAKLVAKRSRDANKVEYEGCCANGCCGFPAVPLWATWDLAASIFLLVAMLGMYTRSNGLKDVVTGLVRTFLSAVNSTVPYAQQFAAAIPPSIINSIEQRQSNLEMLPIAVIVPGIFAFLFLFLAATCPFLGKCQREAHKGSYCCTKCFIALGNLVMLVAFVFYAIFAAVALFLAFAPPDVRGPIEMIHLQCDIIPASINQMIEDGGNALATLASSGQNTTAMQQQFDDIVVLATLADGGCQLILDLFTEFNALFLPAFVACCAIVFAYFVNNFLCCAAGGCCKKDESAAGSGGAAKKGGSVQMTSIGLVGA